MPLRSSALTGSLGARAWRSRSFNEIAFPNDNHSLGGNWTIVLVLLLVLVLELNVGGIEDEEEHEDEKERFARIRLHHGGDRDQPGDHRLCPGGDHRCAVARAG